MVELYFIKLGCVCVYKNKKLPTMFLKYHCF